MSTFIWRARAPLHACRGRPPNGNLNKGQQMQHARDDWHPTTASGQNPSKNGRLPPTYQKSMEELVQCGIRTTVRQRQPAIDAFRGRVEKWKGWRGGRSCPRLSGTGSGVGQVDDHAWPNCQNITSRALRSSAARSLQSPGSERSGSQDIALKRSGDDRKDDRSVKHIDTASDLFPLSLPADGKASNPLF